MGFKDIEAFNLVMLAKQCWRLIHNTHSLFYRVYKSRYFPTCSFMEVDLGNNPSYVWRSLLVVREVIKERSMWKLGDGSSIKVSNHKWLPNRPVFLGTPRPQMYVNELIEWPKCNGIGRRFLICLPTGLGWIYYLFPLLATQLVMF